MNSFSSLKIIPYTFPPQNIEVILNFLAGDMSSNKCKKCAKFSGWVKGYCSVCAKAMGIEVEVEENEEFQEVPYCRKCKKFFGYVKGLCSQCAGVTKGVSVANQTRHTELYEHVKDKYILANNHYRRLMKVFESNKLKFSAKDCHKCLIDCDKNDPYLSKEQAGEFLKIFRGVVKGGELWKYEHVFSHKVLDYWNVGDEFNTGFCYYSMGRQKPKNEQDLINIIGSGLKFYKDQFRDFF